ncbi:SusD/RagB family nutrient-binding outer membrane lipoprotein [Sphingobacterium paucimobilis]|nr:SusD/RagB family nutrient-binding outer membrane lipoprotein [Sphingobacterium paucimobilis]
MSHIHKTILIILVVGLSIAMPGCRSNMDEISKNPNRSEVINPNNLLTYLCLYTFSPDYFGLNRQLDSYFIDWRFGGSHLNWLRRNFNGEYRFLTVSNSMKSEAERLNQPEYLSLARFFDAHWIFTLTRLYGDVPYSEANRINQGITQPKYDEQEEIIVKVLEELATANDELSKLGDKTIAGDIIFGGDLKKWRKMINSYRLKVLINLSQQQQLKGTSIASRFADIVNNPTENPIMEHLEDSPIRDESNNPNNYYLYLDNNFISGYRITQFTAEYMKDRNDYRLTKFAQPTILAENGNLDPNNLQNYAGTNPWPNKENNVNYQYEDSKKISRVNNRYHREPIGPPTMIFGYPEQEFILAEAALRGWINGDVAQHYKNGILASFKYFGLENRGSAFIQQPKVQLAGSDSEKLGQIITQKFLNFFMQGGYEPYFELRRTGYPDFAAYVTPDISTLYNNGQLPLRYLYPLGELTDNKANVTTAISRLPGGDQIFSKMWLLRGSDNLRNPQPFPYQ